MNTLRLLHFMLAILAMCALSGARAEYVDCRICHFEISPENTAPDYTAYFSPEGHHPVRTSYPPHTDYNQPPILQADILFFDHNRNGQADLDEVQIYVTGSGGLIDCASCHMEHGATAPDPNHPAAYLRATQPGQYLCTICHRL